MNFWRIIFFLSFCCLFSLIYYFKKVTFNSNKISVLINDNSNDDVINSEKFLEEHGISYIPKSDRLNIFLIWYGHQFPEIYLKCLQTVVYHHPTSDVLLFSNDLDNSLLDPFREKNYTNVRIVRFNLTKLGQNEPGNHFIQKSNQMLDGKVYKGLAITRVHLSDFLRYFLVYKYGGLYIDTDSFVIKSLAELKNSIGVTDNFSYKCSDKVFNSPKAKNFTCISNSVYHFDRNHAFMKDCLENYDIWWIKQQGYAPAGAIMMMELIENNFEKIDFVPQRKLICFYHLGKTKNIVDENNKDLIDTLENCYTIQLLGAGSSNYKIDNFNITFVGRIFNKFKIF